MATLFHLHILVNKVGDLTVALGKQVAKNVACDSPVAGVPTTSSTMSDVIVIASGGVKGTPLYILTRVIEDADYRVPLGFCRISAAQFSQNINRAAKHLLVVLLGFLCSISLFHLLCHSQWNILLVALAVVLKTRTHS